MDQSGKEKADLCPLLFKHRGGCVNYDHCEDSLQHEPGSRRDPRPGHNTSPSLPPRSTGQTVWQAETLNIQMENI